MDDLRLPLKAIQWERTKRELRAFATLAGSYNSEHSMTAKYLKIKNSIEFFIDQFETLGLHE